MNLAGIIPLSEKAAYLRTLPAIRERCSKVYDLAIKGKLEYFVYHPENEGLAVELCVAVMKKTYGSEENFCKIPPHGRWQHLDAAGVARVQGLLDTWSTGSTGSTSPVDVKEQARRAIDMFTVSVLLDAGAGNTWRYTERETGKTFSRSEGLGVVSFRMFESGFFSSLDDQPYQVDAVGLGRVTVERVSEVMQVTPDNPMVGVDGRTALLLKLGESLKAHPEYFGSDGRPGRIIDFLQDQVQIDPVTGNSVLPLAALWYILIDGLSSIWPWRIVLADLPLGDVWPCPALTVDGSLQESQDLVPFHKLTQWLTYSLIQVFEQVLKWKIAGVEDLTGLPEYRNGGLLVDLGVLALRENALAVDPESGLPHAAPSHPAIVEWRAMTVIVIDRLATGIRSALGLTEDQLSLAQVLESATWSGGRVIAAQKRPLTGGPPIEIDSDGTVF